MKIFFIVNGGRAPIRAKLLETFRSMLAEHSDQHRMEVSQSLDHARRLVDEAAANGFDTLWMGGGDGTINVLLNCALGSKMAFGVVPMGTVNALARSLGIPLEPKAAIRHLLDCEPVPVNVGRINGETLFLCFASIGFDAAVVHDVTGPVKRIFGRVAYFLAGIRAVFRMDRIAPFEVTFTKTTRAVDQKPKNLKEAEVCAIRRQSGYSLMVSNIINYAGFPMFYGLGPQPDAMEFWLFRRRRLDSMLGWAAASSIQSLRIMRRFEKSVGHYLLEDFKVESPFPMFLQIDGEAVSLGDNLSYHFELLPDAAMVLSRRISEKTPKPVSVLSSVV